jgi:hypothetical protein
MDVGNATRTEKAAHGLMPLHDHWHLYHVQEPDARPYPCSRTCLDKAPALVMFIHYSRMA